MLPSIDRARDEAEQRLAKAGVPFRHWRHDIKKIPFRRCVIGPGKKAEFLRPATQRRALKQLIMEPHGQLVVVGSNPTDDGALMAASWVVRELLAFDFLAKFINATQAADRLSNGITGYAVHNVMANCSADRAEQLRDLLIRWTTPVRVVAVAGTQNPYDFCTSRLALKPDFCCYVQDPS